MSSLYSVALTIGSFSITITSADTYDALDAVYVLDGLSMPWSMPPGSPNPAQPDPATCTIGLATRDVNNLPALEIGDPVVVAVTSAGGRVAKFTGRVSDPQINLVRRKNANGTSTTWSLYTILCVDYNVDLSELKLDLTRPSEGNKARLEAIRDAIQAATGLTVTLPPVLDPLTTTDALTAVQAPALQLLTDHLAQVTDISIASYENSRSLVVPVTAGGVLTGWDLSYTSSKWLQTWPAGVFALVAHKLVLQFPGAPPAGGLAGTALSLSVDASQVPEDGIVWRQSKTDGPNTVNVSGPSFGTVTATNDQAAVRPVVLSLQSTLALAATALQMANMYLSDLDSGRWSCDQFTWLPSNAELAAMPFSITPDTDAHDFNCYWSQIAIYDVPNTVNPAGNSGFYGGSIDGAQLQIIDHDVQVVLRVRRELPRPNSPDAKAVTYASLRATFPTVKYRTGTDVMDPNLSYFESRLARKV